MSRKQNSSHEIAINSILKEMSCCFENTYDEIRSSLEDTSIYKRLRKLGEQQFFNATESSNSIEEQSQQTKRQFAEINLLAVSVDNIIDIVVSEKFKSNFLSSLKEEVLEVILKLYSDQDDSMSKKSKSDHNLLFGYSAEMKRMDDVKVVLDKLKDISKYFSQNLDDISKQVIDMPLKKETHAEENMEIAVSSVEGNDKNDENINSDLESISLDSVSSVHTSDLSSFNDEISITSDEETGKKKKRVSLKMVKEVTELRTKRKKAEDDSRNQVKKNRSEASSYVNDSSITSHKSLRTRTPNSKYDDILSFLKNLATEKNTQGENSTPVQESEMIVYLPKKRGRPKKKRSFYT